MNRRWRSLSILLLLAGLVSVAPSNPAQAAGVVGTGTPGSCDEPALETALAGGGLVTFNCGAAQHTIGLTSEKIISVDTQINGGGLITLDGQDQTRIFYINTDIALELTALTLTGGDNSGPPPSNGGGAIHNAGGILTITDSSLNNNSADYGGAILNGAGATLNLTGSVVSENDGREGGALYSLNDSTTTIIDSTLSGNHAETNAGAIYGLAGATTITNSAISDNTSEIVGAIANAGGTLTITGSTISGNVSVGSHAGGIYSRSNGIVTIVDSDIAANEAGASGGGIYAADSTVTITHSTVNNNQARNSGGGVFSSGDNTNVFIADSTIDGNQTTSAGAGIYVSSGFLTMTNSTASNNVMVPASGGVIGSGGGLYNLFGTTTVSNSTFSGNSARTGGGIYNYESGILTVINSTVSDNTGMPDSFVPVVADGIGNAGDITLTNTLVANNRDFDNCVNLGGSFTSAGGNLSDDDSCLLDQPSDLPDTATGLGPLTDNGGPTLTHLPEPDSPAIDSGLIIACPDADQRNIERPQGAGCDIGAVEVRQGATYAICASYYTGAVSSPLSGGCGPGAIELNVPGNLSFCVNGWTGQLTYSFGRTCTPPRIVHTMPDDGDLLTCVNLYTGANRWVTNHSQCGAYDVPNTIPAAP